jgi:magnesium-transporting ATPase (P-type)
MFLGRYTGYFASAYSPWTVLGPLAGVVGISLAVEGYSDVKRHRSDEETNNAECIILRRSDDINRDNDAERETTIIGGKDVIVNLSKDYSRRSSSQTRPDDAQSTNIKPRLVQAAFQKIKRMNIRQGHIVLIRNREAIPADTVILATSGENGCAYIETSSIDGETNLKLRNSPTMPSIIAKNQKNEEKNEISHQDGNNEERIFQSLEKATKNITRFSALAYPDGVSAVDCTGEKGTEASSF